MFLDTHAAVFLHGGLLGEFTHEGLTLLESEPLYFSPMAGLELQYLFEIGRIRFPAKQILDDLKADISLTVMDRNWQKILEKSWELSWTRDPFDRIISAQAAVEKQKLLTRDGNIQKNLPLSVW